MITFKSQIEYYHDNREIMNTLDILSTNTSNFNEHCKSLDHDTVLKLRNCVSPHVIVFRIKEHQDQRKQNQHLAIPEIVNIKVGQLI